ncbi:hypothetical protein, partial [Salmonella sp. s51228]|uniref:hypothetical protein n=1 Tax=Salmonella sp. s51228 TaxID=3159652 RepID=UPI00397F68E0
LSGLLLHPITANIVVHAGIVCKNCNGPITGNRYKCGNCPDYDVCEYCLVKPQIHDETHVFLILRQSCPNAGLYNGHYRPILNNNLYLPSKKDIAKKHDPSLV